MFSRLKQILKVQIHKTVLNLQSHIGQNAYKNLLSKTDQVDGRKMRGYKVITAQEEVAFKMLEL